MKAGLNGLCVKNNSRDRYDTFGLLFCFLFLKRVRSLHVSWLFFVSMKKYDSTIQPSNKTELSFRRRGCMECHCYQIENNLSGRNIDSEPRLNSWLLECYYKKLVEERGPE